MGDVQRLGSGYTQEAEQVLDCVVQVVPLLTTFRARTGWSRPE